MQAAGVRFGSHSYAHQDLTTLDEETCVTDLKASRDLLEDLLQRPVALLAYPGGRHDAKVRRAAERAGFSHAFSLPVRPEPLSPFAVPRVGIWPGNGAFALRLRGKESSATSLHRDHGRFLHPNREHESTRRGFGPPSRVHSEFPNALAASAAGAKGGLATSVPVRRALHPLLLPGSLRDL